MDWRSTSKKKTILVADDLKTNRSMLEIMLGSAGYQTIGAVNGQECLRLAAERQPDLIILDIQMPDISGIEVCRRLHRSGSNRHAQIIFVTAATDDQTLSQAFDAGGNDYIRKPVNRIELLKRIQAAFDHQQMMYQKKEEEKLESALQMSGTICHQLNQPLQYISGITQMLLLELDASSPTRQRVLKMKEQVDRMAEITRQLNQLTNVETAPYVGDTKILRYSK